MAVNWTEDQQKVIESRGCNLLVCAAAGSGKTAVLAERILRLVTDPVRPLDIDSLLVVTFTTAAAAEMKERIRASLENALVQRPDDVHLQQQVTLVHQAMIMTIHSFCLQVIRDHIQQTDLEPGFRVADEGEIRLLKQDVLDQLLEEQYLDPDEAFLRFADTFATGKSDQAMAEAIRRYYDFSMAYPDPAAWREKTLSEGEFRSEEGFDSSIWMQLLRRKAGEELSDMRERLSLALRIAQRPDGPAAYAADLSQHLNALSFEDQVLSYDQLRSCLEQADQWGRLPGRGQPKEMDPEQKDRAKALRDSVKADLAGFRNTYFSGTLEEMGRLMQLSRDVLMELNALTGEYQKRLDEEKRERGIVDFNDLEQVALQILLTGEGQPSEAAKEYAQRFTEVMTDEYQDSNMIQEAILRAVSGPVNRFMVGDVKQSIYKFRQARPELFMEKYHTYKNEPGVPGRKILLRQNFRSRSQVIDIVNMLFAQLMAEDIGGIAYDENAALYQGAFYPDSGSGNSARDDLPELLLVQEAYQEGEDEYGLTIRQEAQTVGRRIRKLMQGLQVYDKQNDAMRDLRYGDIVILLRTMKGWGDVYTSALTEMGIPAMAAAKKGFFSTLEVRTALAFLEVIGNPRQDIALAGVLSSPIGKLSDEELALIRIYTPEGDFYTACRRMLDNRHDVHSSQDAVSDKSRNELQPDEFREKMTTAAEKLQAFFDLLTSLREEAAAAPVHILLRHALKRTGYYTYVTAMPAGAQRKVNLDFLIEQAAAFEQGSTHGLFHFLRTMKQIREADLDFGEASPASEAGDCVRVMSVHTSKGLEYPVVFVCGLGKKINRNDNKERLLLHPEYGAACDYIDTVRRFKVPLLYKNLLSAQMNDDMMGEELRILYVALTRAREKLILVGSGDFSDNKMVQWMEKAAGAGQVLPGSIRRRAQTYLDLVMPAFLRHPDSRSVWESYGKQRYPGSFVCRDGSFILRFVSCTGEDDLLGTLYHDVSLQEAAQAGTASGEMPVLFLEDIITPEEAARNETGTIPGKVSVSFLKHAAMGQPDEESAVLFDAVPSGDSKAVSDPVLSGAQRGTVYHRILENLDYRAYRDRFSDRPAEFVQWQLESLLLCGKIQKDEKRAVNEDDLAAFLSSGIGKRMTEAGVSGTLRRETPFVLGIPAYQADPAWNSEEMILVQGIIDAWFTEEDSIVLVDYKTDRADPVTDPEGSVLADRYRRQLELYQEALERLTGFSVKEKLIYSFSLEKEIPV